jgi:hypothetical protein
VHTCAISLIRDVLSKGMCRNSGGFEGVDISDSCVIDTDADSFDYIVTGTCSTMTQELLTQSECVRALLEQPRYIFWSIELLVHDSCSWNTYTIFTDVIRGLRVRCSVGSYFM